MCRVEGALRLGLTHRRGFAQCYHADSVGAPAQPVRPFGEPPVGCRPVSRCDNGGPARIGVLIDHSALQEAKRTRLHRTALRLEYATIGWNVGEAFLTIALGAIASSLALIGFGTVSVVEVFASAVVVWHLMPGHDVVDATRTARAHRLVAIAFGVLAAVLVTAGVRDLVTGRRPDESPWGIAYLALTALVMFGLAISKRSIATRLDSTPLRSEATMTFLDGALSTATMLGLALNAAFGWWWADPAAALVVAGAAANEARENWLEAGEAELPESVP